MPPQAASSSQQQGRQNHAASIAPSSGATLSGAGSSAGSISTMPSVTDLLPVSTVFWVPRSSQGDYGLCPSYPGRCQFSFPCKSTRSSQGDIGTISANIYLSFFGFPGSKRTMFMPCEQPVSCFRFPLSFPRLLRGDHHFVSYFPTLVFPDADIFRRWRFALDVANFCFPVSEEDHVRLFSPVARIF